MRRKLRLGLTVLALLVTGCRLGRPYHVEVGNATAVELRSVTVSFGRFRFNFGYLDPGIRADCRFANEVEPLPEQATVSWMTAGGASIVRHIAVKPRAPSGLTTLVVSFVVEENMEVSVHFREQGAARGPRAE